MGNWMPQLNPQLLQAAMARQPIPPPPVLPQQPLAAQRVATAPPAAPAGPGAMPPPAAQPTPAPQATPQSAPPRPSDDPAISPEMRKALQPTQDAMGALDTEQKHVSDLEGQAAALHKPTTDEYKPPLWKKIAAPFLGAMMGRNAEPGLDRFMNGPYNRAMQNYDTQSGALQRQLDAERGINVPLAQDKARVAQEGFKNWMEIQKDQREKTAFDNEPTGRMPEVRTGADGQPHYFQKTKGGQEIEVPEPANITTAHERENANSNTPAPGASPEPDPDNKGQYRVKTKGGGYMPWSPKTPEEGAMVGDPRATGLFNREHPGREPKEGAEPGSWSAADKREFDSKTRRFNGQIDALNHQRANLSMLPESPATKPMLDNVDKQLKALYDQVDAVEQQIETRHAAKPSGSQPSAKTFSVPKGAPNPSKPGQQLKMNGKVVAQSADGKTWGAPQGQ